MELLYKSFWVFDVEYPAPLMAFYRFLDRLFEVDWNPAVVKKKKPSKPCHPADLMYDMIALQEIEHMRVLGMVCCNACC